MTKSKSTLRLPAPGIGQSFYSKRKAQVLQAIADGLLTEAEARRRWNISAGELAEWRNGCGWLPREFYDGDVIAGDVRVVLRAPYSRALLEPGRIGLPVSPVGGRVLVVLAACAGQVVTPKMLRDALDMSDEATSTLSVTLWRTWRTLEAARIRFPVATVYGRGLWIPTGKFHHVSDRDSRALSA